MFNLSKLFTLPSQIKEREDFMAKPLLFLDIDGVLNTENNKDKRLHHYAPSGAPCIFEKTITPLKIFLKRTNSKIILTSSWQEDIFQNTKDGMFLLEMLKHYDIHIENFTRPLYPDDFDDEYNELRGKTIKRMLTKKSKFVIFDDRRFDFEKEGLMSNFVKINPKKGLVFKDIQKAFEIINANNNFLDEIHPRLR